MSTSTRKTSAPTSLSTKKTTAAPKAAAVPAKKTVAKAPAKKAAAQPPDKVAAKAPAKRMTSREAMLARVESVRLSQRAEGHFDCFGRADKGFCDQGVCSYHAECLSISGMLHSV